MITDHNGPKKLSHLKFNSLISALARGYFLIEERYAEQYLPFVARILKGEPVDFQAGFFEDDEEKPEVGYILTPNGNRFEKHSEDDHPTEGSIYVMALRGPVMKEDFCGSAGTATLLQKLKLALQHENISSAVFITDTGGGSVDGTFELADAIVQLQAENQKPVVGFVEGMSCSAGYALMAPCAQVVLSHKTAEVGSIGVCCSIRDFRKRLKKMGVKEHYFNASTSPDKNQDYLKARDGDGSLLVKRLDELHVIFKDTVKAGRPDISDSAMTGKVYLADEAISLNMANAIGSFEDAVNLAHELANPSNT